jgi:hypothetical protein
VLFRSAQDVNGVSYITFANSLTTDDVIVLKTKSKYPKNKNGYYEIAKNFAVSVAKGAVEVKHETKETKKEFSL